jgi:hypothetical protein
MAGGLASGGQLIIEVWRRRINEVISKKLMLKILKQVTKI